MKESKNSNVEEEDNLQFTKVVNNDGFPSWIDRDFVVNFFHETMKPYNDSVEDIRRALDYAFSNAEGKGGFLMLAHYGQRIAGQLLMLKTGMGGYIPENILLFVTISPQIRGKGIGGKLIKHSLNEADGNIKLHVEHDNPAQRLYERLGFTQDYAEMRYFK